MRAVPVLVVLLALAPAALAQLPAPPSACGPLAVNAPATIDATAGSERPVLVTVQNRGPAATVALRIETPPGWNATATPATAAIAQNALADFTVALRVPAGASGPGEITVTAAATCGPLPVQTARQSATSAVTVAAPATGLDAQLRDLAEAYGVPVLAAALVAGAAAATFVGIRRTRAGLRLDAPEPMKRLRPGRGVSFPLSVENRGRDAETVRFEVGRVPAGWAAFTALPEVSLAAGERRTMWLMVRAPPASPDGASASIEVTARSDARPERAETCHVRAEVADVTETTAAAETEIPR